MEPTYIQRALGEALLNAIRQFPAVVLTGPRQSGKTTLLRRLCRDTATYVSLRIFHDEYGERAAPGWVIHPGDITLPLGPGVVALPFRNL